MSDSTPNPGSDDALALGCTCPILDNCHGQGIPYPNKSGEIVSTFWVNGDCPIHGLRAIEEEQKQAKRKKAQG